MVEAAIPLLETLGVPDKRIYYDKFTTTGEPMTSAEGGDSDSRAAVLSVRVQWPDPEASRAATACPAAVPCKSCSCQLGSS